MTTGLIGHGRKVTLCDQCGQVDDHPKSHGPGAAPQFNETGVLIMLPTTKHHDCLSVAEIEALVGSGQAPNTLAATKIVAMCAEDGKKGAALLDAIFKNQPKHKDSAILAASFANDVLDQVLPNGASGTFVVGPTTYTLPFRVLFLSTVSTAGAQGTEWTTSGGYTSSSGGGAVGGVALNGLVTSAAAAQSKANTGAVTVTNAPAQTWADNEVHDSTPTTQKRVAAKGTPSLAKTVNSGDTCTIPIGSLTATLV